MDNKPELLLKLVLRTGQVINLISNSDTVGEILDHPKFLRMRDNANDIFVSIEDIAAFEILNNRKPEPTETKTEPVLEENGAQEIKQETN